MLYYNKNKSKKNHIIRIIVIVAVILLSSLSPQASNITSNIVSLITSPIAKATTVITNGLRSAVDYTFGTKPNRDMVNQLTLENQELQKKVNDLQLIVNQSPYLKQAYDFTKLQESINAKVIMYDNDNLYSQFKIDKGTINGVEDGDIVVTSYTDESENIIGALIGKVTRADMYSSNVSSILDESYNISFVHADTGINGIIDERSDDTLDGYLLSKTDIEIGQKIYTGGIGGRYPRGIYIGKVKEINETADKLTQLVSVESPIEFDKLYQVNVLKSDQIVDGVEEWKKDI